MGENTDMIGEYTHGWLGRSLQCALGSVCDDFILLISLVDATQLYP